MKSMEQFVYDTLVNNLTQDYETVEDLIDEIREQYDEDIANDLAGV